MIACLLAARIRLRSRSEVLYDSGIHRMLGLLTYILTLERRILEIKSRCILVNHISILQSIILLDYGLLYIIFENTFEYNNWCIQLLHPYLNTQGHLLKRYYPGGINWLGSSKQKSFEELSAIKIPFKKAGIYVKTTHPMILKTHQNFLREYFNTVHTFTP